MKISFIGGGNMARALITGLLGDGTPAQHIPVVESDANKRQQLQQEFGINTSEQLAAAAHAESIILAVKPQQLRDIAIFLASLLQQQLVISIAAGIRTTDLMRWYKAVPAMRDYLDDLCGPEGLPVRSPILRVAQIDVPVLLIHGEKDENVPVDQTTAMAEALRNHGKDVETLVLPGATHFFSEQEYATALRKLFDFLRRHLSRS